MTFRGILVWSLGSLFLSAGTAAPSPPPKAPAGAKAPARAKAATGAKAPPKSTGKSAGKSKQRGGTARAAKAKPANPGATLVTSRLIETLSKNPDGLDSLRRPWAMDLVLRTGDVTAAREFLEVGKLGTDNLRFVGELCTMVPGGVNGAQARELLSKYRVQVEQYGTKEGLATGYARAGKIKEAIAQARSDQSLMSKLMTVRPAEAIVDAYLGKPGLTMNGAYAGRLLWAQRVLGREAEAEALVREIRADAAAGKADPKAKVRISVFSDDAETEIFRATFFAHLARGEFDAARALEQEQFAKATSAIPQAKDQHQAEFGAQQRRLEAYHALVAAMALKGDQPAAQAATAEVRDVYGVEVLNVPMAYAVAKAWDAARVDEAMKELPELLKSSPNLHAAALGAASAGRHAAGDAAGAKRYAEEGLALVASIQGESQQGAAMFRLLAGTVLGPEALLFVDHSFQSYPLHLPN